MRAPLDDPSMSAFTSRIDEINTLAESAPGFVWRWTGSDAGPFNNPNLLFNLTVWEAVAALRAYVYAGPHVELFRDRSDWFLPSSGPTLALWWVPVGHRPTPEESKERLDHLTEHGPMPFAFDFKHSFPAP
jgi:Domain of unknown function (DUF3291)